MLDFDERIHGEELSNMWRYLMMNKKIYKIFHYNQYNANNSLERNEDEMKILDWLTDMGYVDKKKVQMYIVGITSEYSLLKPSLFPFGYFSLNGNSSSDWKQHTLDEDDYENFIGTYNPIKNDIEDKKWRHIEYLDTDIIDKFDNIRYEVKDIFFDTIYIGWNNKEKKINITLVEPFFNNAKSDSKNWRKIKELPTDSFIINSEHIKKEVDKLDWKKKIKGIITFEGKCYFLEYPDSTKLNSEIIDVLINLDLSDLSKATEEFDKMRSREFINVLGNDINKLRDDCNNASMKKETREIFKTTDNTRRHLINLEDRICTNEYEVLEFAEEVNQIFRKSYNTGQNLISIFEDEILDVIYKLTIKKGDIKNNNIDIYIGKIYKRFTKTSLPNSQKEWFLVQVGIMLGIRFFLNEKIKLISRSDSDIIS